VDGTESVSSRPCTYLEAAREGNNSARSYITTTFVDKPAKGRTRAQRKVSLEAGKGAETSTTKPSWGRRALADNEKDMTLQELYQKWNAEEGKKTEFGYVSTTTLKPHQKDWNRGQVRGLMRHEIRAQWVTRMREKGVPLERCNKCGDMVPTDHQCIIRKWQDKAQRRASVLGEKALVVSQTGARDIKVSLKDMVDVYEARSKLQKLEQQSAAYDATQKALATPVGGQPQGASPEGDVEMKSDARKRTAESAGLELPPAGDDAASRSGDETTQHFAEYGDGAAPAAQELPASVFQSEPNQNQP
jgi:hypothetical protein